jgi:hypothetical protein
MDTIQFDKESARSIVMYAFRYTLGRYSTAPTRMQKILETIWGELYTFDKERILEEILEYKETMKKFYGDKPWDLQDKYSVATWTNWREKMLLHDI